MRPTVEFHYVCGRERGARASPCDWKTAANKEGTVSTLFIRS